MRHLTTVALMLNLGIASLYAQQPAEEHSGASRVRMRFSGSTMSTTLAIAPNTLNHESQVAGNSSLGPFTYRGLWADEPSQSSGSCGSGFGPINRVVAGGGVFRFEDGSLLSVGITEGDGCVNLTAGVALLTVKYQITGGTGRFEGASGELTMTATQMAVLRNAAGMPALLMFTGEFEGTIAGVARERKNRNGRQ